MHKIKVFVAMLLSFFTPVVAYLLNSNSNYYFLQLGAFSHFLLALNIVLGWFCYFCIEATRPQPDIGVPAKSLFVHLIYTLLPVSVLLEVIQFFR